MTSSNSSTNTEEKRGHTMRVEIDPIGYISLTPVCHEQDGRAICRVECPHQECREEGWSLDDHRMPEEDFGEDDYHGLRPIDHCNAVEWLSSDDVPDYFESDKTAPLYDGMPIRVWWDGDTYRWQPITIPSPPSTES